MPQMPRRAMRARRYMGTMYFPTLEKRESWAEYMNQWYVELEKEFVLSEIQDLVEGGLKLKGHVEPCKGSQKQNMDYVSKPSSSAVAEFPELQHRIGEPCRQGSRSDLNEAAADIVSGKRTLADLTISCFERMRFRTRS